MRIIIEIDGGEVAAAPTALISQKAPTGVLTAAAAIGAADAGSAPAGMMSICMETEERAEEKAQEPVTLAKERALDAGSAPEDLLRFAVAPTEALRKAPSFAESFDAGKPPRSLLEEMQGGIKND